MTKGTLYGIGVGPGDPELLTLKAKRILSECEVLLVPRKSDDADSTALDIITPTVDITGKKLITQTFGMVKDPAMYYEYGKQSADIAEEYLSKGMDVAFITLGDISTFSTFFYMQYHMAGRGYDVELVPGISSYCAGAAITQRPLILGKESLAVVPSIDNIEKVREAIGNYENVVIMKAGRNISAVAEIMTENGFPLSDTMVISNLGMEDEYVGPLDDRREYGYFTTILVRRSKE